MRGVMRVLSIVFSLCGMSLVMTVSLFYSFKMFEDLESALAQRAFRVLAGCFGGSGGRVGACRGDCQLTGRASSKEDARIGSGSISTPR